MPPRKAAIKKAESSRKGNSKKAVFDEDGEGDDSDFVSDGDDVDGKDADPWVTKAETQEEMEALEAELNPESLVLTEAKESREPPPIMVMSLLPYQKEFLAWAIKQELGAIRGGVLADEMGMGKTIQAVSIIVSHPREGEVLGPSRSLGATPGASPAAAAPLTPALKLRMPVIRGAGPLQPPSQAGELETALRAGSCGAGLLLPESCVGSNVLASGVVGSGMLPPTVRAGSGDPLVAQASVAGGNAVGTLPEVPIEAMPGGQASAALDPGSPLAHNCDSRVDASEPPSTPPLTKSPAALPASAGDTDNGATPASQAGATPGKATPGKRKPGKVTKAKKPRVDPMRAAMEQAKHCKVQEEEGDEAFCNATLVICPVVAAIQWRQEIMRYTAPGSMNILLYHGSNRATDFTRAQLEAADVVLTTYSILEVDFRRNLMTPKATCTYCNRKFQPERLKVHLRYFCGPYAVKTDAQAKQQKKRMPWMRNGGGGKGKGGDKGASTSKAGTSKVAAAEEDDEDQAGAATAKAAEEEEEEEETVKKPAAKKRKTAGKAGAVATKAHTTVAAPKLMRTATAGSKALDSSALEGALDDSVSDGDDAFQAVQVGAKRKAPSKPAKKPAAAKKPPAKPKRKTAGAGGGKKKARGRGGGGDDSEASSDWAPSGDGDEDEVDEDDDTSETEDELTATDEDEDMSIAAARKVGAGKARGNKPTELMDDEDIDAAVDKMAAVMIAQAQKARDAQAESTSLLHDIRWRRVILDEAHSIKDRRCNTAQAAFALTARYRWGLSGTPLQNRVTELYSLVRFLRIHPYAFYFADKTQCCSLDFPFKHDVRKCDLCGGSRMSHYCWWNRRVANPIKYHGYEGRGRTAMMILKHQILPRILLRRTKLQCADDLALPPRRVLVRKDPFDAREADFYEALYTQSQAAFGGYVESGTVLNNYAHIFDLLIRLRQAVNHPYLVVYSASGGRNDNAPGGAAGAPVATEAVLGVCGICHDPVEDGVPAACGHAFCRVCVTEYLDNAVGACKCPACDRPLTIDLAAPASAATTIAGAPRGRNGASSRSATAASAGVPRFKKSSILNRIDMATFQSSTKLEALNEEVDRMLRADPSAKCIIFSQFTSMLDLAQFRLQQVGRRCVKLDGSMSLDARNRMIRSFNEDPEVTCFLMSLKAGGVALNLTIASHVMLMDPWWNPAVEQQAQDRIHRLGQFKPISVTRFFIAGTIEERILKLQEKKQLVFEGTVGRDAEALGKLTVDDLRFLFG